MAEAAAPESQTFGNIRLGGKDAHRDESVGTLRLYSEGVGWKSRATGNVISVSKADLRKAEWIKIPHAHQLKLRARGGFVYKYNGFRGQDKETVRGYLSNTFGLEVEDAKVSYKGWNWGTSSVGNGAITFAIEDNTALEIPLTDVASAASQKNEAVIEMQMDDTVQPDDEVITEIRFFLPPDRSDEAGDGDATPAEGFVELVKQSGDLEVAGASLVTLDDLQVQVPRGRYDVELCDKFMRLHGKTNDYKILYTNVSGLYLVPKQDGHHMSLVISLEHPLRQGATSYPHLVFQLPRDQPTDVEVQLSEGEIASRFGDKLDKFESGDMPSVVGKVISAFAKKKVQGIKSGGFNAESKEDRNKSIRCSLKAVDGFLYPLDKVFFFLSNKPVLISFDNVSSVEFNRVDQASSSAAARTFDITVHAKDNSADAQFVNLQRQDYKEFVRFLQAKKVRIKNFAAAGYSEGRGRGGADDDDDDPYMNQIRERERARQQAAADDDDDDDDDDEDDEDFVGGSGSEVDEEFDEGDEDDEESAFKKEKGKKKKAKTEDSDEDSDGGSDDGSDEEKPAKAKKPAKSKAEGKRPAEALGIMGGGKKAKTEKGAKKKKAKKDPNAPKRGQTAFMLWMNGEGRDQARETNPSATIGEIGKACGEVWRNMDAETKATWQQKADADKARYEREMAEYNASAKTEEPDDDNEAEAEASDDDDE